MSRVLIFAVLAVVLGAAGALGKAAHDSRASQQPTASAPDQIGQSVGWAAEASSICRKAYAEVSGLGALRSETPEVLVGELIGANERWNDELLALPPPPGKRKLVERLRRLLMEDERLLRRMLGSLRARDAASLSRVVREYAHVGSKQQALFRTLGAIDCVQSRATPAV